MHAISAPALDSTATPACLELRRRLEGLELHCAPDDPEARAIRIGIEDERGLLMHVVETTRLVEAIKVFELLGELGWLPREGRSRGYDGRPLTRSYRLRR
jgi:hypothetical protein